MVDSPDLSPDTPSTDLPCGLPASFWLDLRDDVSAWREGLPDATIRVLEADNRLFFPGTGPSTPADYATAQHVDPEALTTITTWMLRTTRD
ncbi:hypothetical protein ACXC9Q_35805 [Kribbella sp. CWNU-51]